MIEFYSGNSIVQHFFKELHGGGYLKDESVDQLLCQKCDRYLADRFVEGTCPHLGCGYEDARGDQCDGCGKLINAIELIRPRCKVCNTAPVIRASKQFFIDLPKVSCFFYSKYLLVRIVFHLFYFLRVLIVSRSNQV